MPISAAHSSAARIDRSCSSASASSFPSVSPYPGPIFMRMNSYTNRNISMDNSVLPPPAARSQRSRRTEPDGPGATVRPQHRRDRRQGIPKSNVVAQSQPHNVGDWHAPCKFLIPCEFMRIIVLTWISDRRHHCACHPRFENVVGTSEISTYHRRLHHNIQQHLLPLMNIYDLIMPYTYA
jgi:hypothetical protein